MSELSDEASEPELLNRSLSMWHGLGTQVSREELDVPLDLHTAASIGQYEVVKECAERRELDLNKKNGGGWTPLMYASYIGHDTIVHLLLEAGVSVNVPTPEGQTPLMLASSCGNESIAYFLLQQGAELEMKDIQGWTALFHCTSAGHPQMVKFLLDSGANANVREPVYGFTPLMEAAAAGHEIIVQYFLNHGVEVDTRDHSGATARMLAKQCGHTKIVGLIDAHSPSLPKALYRSPGKYEDLSSSDESCPVPQRQRPCRRKGLSIHEGPRALARLTALGLGGKTAPPCYEQELPRGYVTFNSSDENPLEAGGLCYRDVTSPINDRDVESSSSSSREEPAFCAPLGTARSSSSEGLARAHTVSSEGSLESNEDSDHTRESSVRKQTKSYLKTKNRYHGSDSQWPPGTGTPAAACSSGHSPQSERAPYAGPQDLATLLEQIGCLKYLQVFEEQDVDLRIFLTLTESDLKEIGITLFGPKRKMTSAIARWHSSARPPSDALELAYADRLEAEMQELAIQLHRVSGGRSAWQSPGDSERHRRKGPQPGDRQTDGAGRSGWSKRRSAPSTLPRAQRAPPRSAPRTGEELGQMGTLGVGGQRRGRRWHSMQTGPEGAAPAPCGLPSARGQPVRQPGQTAHSPGGRAQAWLAAPPGPVAQRGGGGPAGPGVPGAGAAGRGGELPPGAGAGRRRRGQPHPAAGGLGPGPGRGARAGPAASLSSRAGSPHEARRAPRRGGPSPTPSW
ncbi:ankyrin repeat and SAM domain-containing protein 3 isoform X3 [Dasypus novemcinctus]|nr:ankyrin repeat and SAM domain-containing protein 3 isoform X3 [Dasypus novemcinctus]XP_058142525.1 ankyrin repeat and SAM domain-containing protein 3 isoform X3 [Dasypus novemcinctus]